MVSLNPPEPRGSPPSTTSASRLRTIGNYSAAEAAFDAALQRDPGFAAAAANLVETALQAGGVRSRAAVRPIASWRSPPASLRARYSRGLVALRQNDLSSARADFAALTAAAPSYALAHYDLAVVEVREGDYVAAQSELQAALALSPNYARARFALATLMVRADRRAEASANLARVIQDADDSRPARTGRQLARTLDGEPTIMLLPPTGVRCAS